MKIRIRLVPKRLRNIACSYPQVTLQGRTRYGYANLLFRVDTGADFSTIPVAMARREGIEFAQTSLTRGIAAGLVGTAEKHHGSIQVRIAGEEFTWPCDFLVTPAPSLTALHESQGRASLSEYAVLGRAGFLSAFTCCIDNEYLTLTRRNTHRPWWYRLARRLWPDLPRRRTFRDPL